MISKDITNGKTDCKSDTESFEEISESDLVELQAHKSPTSETSDTTLTYGSLNSQTDDIKEMTDDKEECILNPSEQKFMTDLLEKYALGKIIVISTATCMI